MQQLSRSLALRALRERAGLSMDAFARAMGYKGASSVQRYESPEDFGDTDLPFNFIKRAAGVLAGRGDPPIRAEELYALAGIGADLAVAPAAAPEPDAAGARFGPRDLPVFGRARGGPDGVILLDNTPIDWTYRPAELQGTRDAFAVFVDGDSMSPRYEPGDTLFVHPNLPVRRGCYVVVELTDHQAYIKQLVRLAPDVVELRQFNPDKRFEIPRARVRAIYRVIGSMEG